MAGYYPARSRLLEFSLAVAVIVVLAAVLLQALVQVEADAERTVVEATVRNMDSGLRLVQAQQITQQMEKQRAGLLRENPMAWLEKPPPDYAGAFERIDPERLERGRWAWDRGALTLYYRPRRDEGLKTSVGNGWLAWQVKAPGGRTAKADAPLGILRIEAKFAYVWRP